MVILCLRLVQVVGIYEHATLAPAATPVTAQPITALLLLAPPLIAPPHRLQPFMLEPDTDSL